MIISNDEVLFMQSQSCSWSPSLKMENPVTPPESPVYELSIIVERRNRSGDADVRKGNLQTLDKTFKPLPNLTFFTEKGNIDNDRRRKHRPSSILMIIWMLEKIIYKWITWITYIIFQYNHNVFLETLRAHTFYELQFKGSKFPPRCSLPIPKENS